MIVRFFTPFLWMAAIRFSGFPQRPNPPDMITAPSWRSRIASSAFATTLFTVSLRSPWTRNVAHSARYGPRSFALHDQCDPFPAADAERGEAALLSEIFHRVDQRHQQPAAARADRVA